MVVLKEIKVSGLVRAKDKEKQTDNTKKQSMRSSGDISNTRKIVFMVVMYHRIGCV